MPLTCRRLRSPLGHRGAHAAGLDPAALGAAGRGCRRRCCRAIGMVERRCPAALRSSGTSATPARIAASGSPSAQRLAVDATRCPTRPDRRRRSPARARCGPAPTIPAMPKISPGTDGERRRRGSARWRTVSPSHRAAPRRSVGAAVVREQALEVAADHVLDQLSRPGPARCRATATQRPSRSTTMRSAIRAISSSRWLDIDERDALGPQRVDRPRTGSRSPRAPSAAVGSSRISSFASSVSALAISTCCWAATRSVAHHARRRRCRGRAAAAARGPLRSSAVAVDPPAASSASGRRRRSRRSTRSGSSRISWWIMPMPAAIASPG